MANKGRNMEITDIIKAVPVSIVETIGLAKPPVLAVEAKRVVVAVPEIAAAVPPPAIIAKAQVITGLKSDTVDNITTVPAKAASGIDALSKRLSI